MKVEVTVILEDVDQWFDFSDPNSEHKESLNELRIEIQDQLEFINVEKRHLELKIIE